MNELTVPLLVAGSVILGVAATLRSLIDWRRARRRQAPAKRYVLRAARNVAFIAVAAAFAPAVGFVTSCIKAVAPESLGAGTAAAAVFATVLFVCGILLMRATLERAQVRGAE